MNRNTSSHHPVDAANTALQTVKQDHLVPLLRNVTGPDFFATSWMAAQTITILVFIGISWLLASLASVLRRQQQQKKNSCKLVRLAMIPVGLALCRVISSQAAILGERLSRIDKQGDLVCEITFDVSTVCYLISMQPVYLFLFYRQRTLYRQPTLQHLNTRLVAVLNWAFIAITAIVAPPSGLYRRVVILITMWTGRFIKKLQTIDLVYRYNKKKVKCQSK